MAARGGWLPGLLVAVLLGACGQEPSTPQERTLAPSEDSLRVEAEPDTMRASGYAVRAEQFAEAAQYDSALVYFEQASRGYEAAGAWERYVWCYNQLGEQARRKGAFEQAMGYLEQGLERGLSELGEQHPEVAWSYNNIGIVYDEKGDYEQALDYYDKALSIQLNTLGEQHPEVAWSYNNIGIVYQEKGDYEQALDYYDKALSIRLKTLGQQHPDVAATYDNIGIVHRERGDYEQALDYYDKALVIKQATRGEQHSDVALTYHNIGTVYRDKGDYEQALAYYDNALSIWLKTLGQQHSYVAINYGNIAVVYWNKGDYEQALDYLQRALSIQLSTLGEQHPNVAWSYNNIGVAYYEKDDFDQALDYFQKALVIKQATLGEQHPEVALTYDNIGGVYGEKGDHEQALAYVQRALSIWLKALGEHHPWVAGSYTGIGTMYREKGDYEQALAYYDKALSIQLSILGEQHPEVAKSYNNIGVVYEEKGDYEQALTYLQRALHANLPAFSNLDSHTNPTPDSLPGALSQPLLLESLSAKAHTLTRRAATQPQPHPDLQAALTTYHLAVRLIDQIRHGYQAEASKLALAQEATNLYDAAIKTALHLSRLTGDDQPLHDAFLFAEKNKAGLLREALAEAQARRYAGLPDSLLAREHRLRIDLAGYQTSLAQEHERPLAEQDSARIALFQEKLFGLRQDYQALLARLGSDYPRYFELKYQTRTASVEELQRTLLDNKTALVEYFTGADSLFIFTLTASAFQVTSVVRDSLLEHEVEALRRGVLERDYARYTDSAYRLYQRLLEPVQPLLQGTEHLIVIPDGMLSYVPFEALLTHQPSGEGLQDYRGLPYLLNDYAISYGLSATLLLQTHQREAQEAGGDFLAFAPVFPEGLYAEARTASFLDSVATLDPGWSARAGRGALPGTRAEVLSIEELFQGQRGFFGRLLGGLQGRRTRVYLEAAAREERIKSAEAGRYRYVHLATHGFFSEQQPALSRLLLAPEAAGSGEDGVLHLGEVYTLELRAELVVLSACETGLGRLAQGEGLLGLTRGFLYAGAEAVMVSLWQVSDVSTRDVMVGFYRELLGGQERAEALRRAKLEQVRGSAERAQPYFWAGFILVGR